MISWITGQQISISYLRIVLYLLVVLRLSFYDIYLYLFPTSILLYHFSKRSKSNLNIIIYIFFFRRRGCRRRRGFLSLRRGRCAFGDDSHRHRADLWSRRPSTRVPHGAGRFLRGEEQTGHFTLQGRARVADLFPVQRCEGWGFSATGLRGPAHGYQDSRLRVERDERSYRRIFWQRQVQMRMYRLVWFGTD